MQLANLESREVLLAKLAGAMKGSLAKAARVFDALRIKLESEQGAPAVVVSEPAANEAVAEVPAPAATAEAVVVTEEETPEVLAEVADATEAVVEEVTPESEEKE
jgi:large subunit ribosomal protein L10